jgi:hypothetical protein
MRRRAMELIDSFGRKTVFNGTLLVEENTDTDDRRKPHWLEIQIWRTEKGSFVVLRTIHYRIFHAVSSCSRADGFTLVEAGADDNYYCSSCARNSGPTDCGYAQEERISVDVYSSPQKLIESFLVDGRYNYLARSVLAELSEKDKAVNAAWNVVVVP